MTSNQTNLPLSRGRWTLSRYLSERSPAPMPPVARAGDDVLHVAKLAAGAALPRAVYVVDDRNRILGTIPDGRLAREIFEHLDPAAYLEKHPRHVGHLSHLEGDASKIIAGSLMAGALELMSVENTIEEAMRALYNSEADELPVTDAEGRLIGIIRALDILREWFEDKLTVQLGDETGSYY